MYDKLFLNAAAEIKENVTRKITLNKLINFITKYLLVLITTLCASHDLFLGYVNLLEFYITKNGCKMLSLLYSTFSLLSCFYIITDI